MGFCRSIRTDVSRFSNIDVEPRELDRREEIAADIGDIERAIAMEQDRQELKIKSEKLKMNLPAIPPEMGTTVRNKTVRLDPWPDSRASF